MLLGICPLQYQQPQSQLVETATVNVFLTSDLSTESFDTPFLSGGGDLATPRGGTQDHATLSAPMRADSSLDRFATTSFSVSLVTLLAVDPEYTNIHVILAH